MPRVRHTTSDLHQTLHGLLAENELRADDAHPEYSQFVYHGRPATLTSTLLHHFGASLSQLKALEAEHRSLEWEWEKIKHPLRRRFTPLAWTCLDNLSGGAEAGDWAQSHAWAFAPRTAHTTYDGGSDRRRRPWLYDACEFDQSGLEGARALHPGCTELPLTRPLQASY
ncbi:hypothetical protein OG883_44195 [Streptomyces sp. NBC_01142]|uniref:hypothetical protein n=1 Tax=Streptomyces sp. NBC_01142 TaxID=2975865 RepID=UPI0022506B69|nr:hypothetical protein [Streptomyces sp. NBC_01142]MCX4826645.1 hypothetical protein [Streptomyces sp. NBC_01142]